MQLDVSLVHIVNALGHMKVVSSRPRIGCVARSLEEVINSAFYLLRFDYLRV